MSYIPNAVMPHAELPADEPGFLEQLRSALPATAVLAAGAALLGAVAAIALPRLRR